MFLNICHYIETKLMMRSRYKYLDKNSRGYKEIVENLLPIQITYNFKEAIDLHKKLECYLETFQKHFTF